MNVAESVRGTISRSFSEAVNDNPVVVKELRTRMRGKKAFIIMGSYVLFLGIVLLITAYSYFGMRSAGMSQPNSNIGQLLFMSLTWAQTILLALVIPAVTSGALTQELEKKTIELLALTRLSPGKVVFGKLLSAVLYSLVLLVCSIPLAGICVMVGGISPAEIAVTYLILVSWVCLFVSIGVFWSSMFLRTSIAGLLSYAASGGYLLLTASLGASLFTPYARSSISEVHPLAAFNPGMAPYLGMAHSSVCGIHFPVAFVPIILNLALGMMLYFIAAMHVKHCRAEKALPVRVLAILLPVTVTWLAVGDKSIQAVQADPLSLIGIFSIFFYIFIGLPVTLFATGPVRKGPGVSMLAYVLSPRKMFKSDLGGAVSFVLAWGAAVYATFGATFFWAVKVYHMKLDRAFWPEYFHIGASLLAVLAAIASVGILVSAFSKNRRTAVALNFLFIVLVFGIGGVIIAQYIEGMNPRGLIWQLMAFWPATPLLALGKNYNPPLFWWPFKSSWLVVSLIYLAIAAAALSASSIAYRKTGGVQEDE
ncbi:MAG: ABC transporter permease [Armatimonadota bacterium]